MKRLKLTFSQSNHLWTFESLHKLVNLSELEFQHVDDQFDDIQIVNLAKISSWKVFKFSGQYCESTDPLIKLFSSLKSDVLEKLELHMNCIVDLHQIFEAVGHRKTL